MNKKYARLAPAIWLWVILLVAAGLVSCPDPVSVSRNTTITTDTEGVDPGDMEDLLDPDSITDKKYTEETGGGALISKGKAPEGSRTYYIDAENGNDAWRGTTPLQPWKSFKNANGKEFKPGDHILLEADSIWNGEAVTPANFETLAASDRVGMLWPHGSGETGKPIVIDLYDIDSFSAEEPVVYYSANQRPLINGNGTPSIDHSKPYDVSGVITLLNQNFWEIRNIEVTNTFDPLTDPNHWFKMAVPKALAGIYVQETNSTVRDSGAPYRHIVVQNCYVHDVQSESDNNGQPIGSPSDYFASVGFGGTHYRGKGVGGIIIMASDVLASANPLGYDVLVEGCIVRRVGLEGLRSGGAPNKAYRQIVFKGNYLEHIAGDGIVLAQTSGGSVVESNIIKDSCASQETEQGNYAACWAYYANDSVFQYNEAYGTLYGNLDGEAWDFDNSCDKLIYQYNYSHHNAGGVVLFMTNQSNNVFRYNISANDGGSTNYMATIAGGTGALPVLTTVPSATLHPQGQTLIHYLPGATSGTNAGLIHNNTFFVGDGITCGLFGYTTATRAVYVRFYNNILVKAGAGKVILNYNHKQGSVGQQVIQNFTTGGFKNNIVWGYASNPGTGDSSKFEHNSVAANFSHSGNLWQNPNLGIQQSSAQTDLRAQRDSVLNDFINPAALATFTGKERLRGRAALFAPASSPGAGMAITSGNVDGAWAGTGFTEDFFGKPVSSGTPSIGAASGPY